jgi:hypothetical protein
MTKSEQRSTSQHHIKFGVMQVTAIAAAAAVRQQQYRGNHVDVQQDNTRKQIVYLVIARAHAPCCGTYCMLLQLIPTAAAAAATQVLV